MFDTVTPQQWSEIILGAIGIIVSLVARYVPKVRKWYEKLPHQGTFMMLVCAFVGLVYFALSCTPLAEPIGLEVTCTSANLFSLFKALLIIGAGNQLTYAFTPKSETLEAVKATKALMTARKMKLIQ